MLRALTILALAVAPAIWGSAACTGSDPEVSESPSEVMESLAIVALTWVPNSPGLAQVYVIDHVAGRRGAALDLLSLPSVGLALDTSLGLGECRVESSLVSPANGGARPSLVDSGPMLLRDAGEIVVDAGLGARVLDSSWLPEGSLDISGVSYTGLVGPRRRGARVPIEIVAEGSAEVGPFTVELTPPPAVKLLTVAGHEVARGRVQLGAADLLQHLDITWEPVDLPSAEATGPTSSDLTVVVFERRTFGATWTVSCVAEDDGHFAIPSGALMTLPDLGTDRTDSIVVRRISSASFAARHVPEGIAIAVSEDQAYVE